MDLKLFTDIVKQDTVRVSFKKNKIKYTIQYRPAKYQRMKQKKKKISLFKFLKLCKYWAENKGYILWSSSQGVEIKDISGFFVKHIEEKNEDLSVISAVGYIFENQK